MKGFCASFALFVLFVVTNLHESESQDVVNTPCNITTKDSCPDNYCCVRDEFLFTETYCRPYGTANSNCGTRQSSFECPCEAGYKCASNIHGHITSLFGKCFSIQVGSTVDSNTDSTTDSMTTKAMDRATPDGATKNSDGNIVG